MGRKKGFKHDIGTRKKIGIAQIGRIISPEHRRRISIALKGEKSRTWKGGISPINEIIRKSYEYRLWRKAVLLRDNFTCIWCGKKDNTVQVDHIKPFAYFPELRFAIDNGRVLCFDCHKTTETYGPHYKNN